MLQNPHKHWPVVHFGLGGKSDSGYTRSVPVDPKALPQDAETLKRMLVDVTAQLDRTERLLRQLLQAKTGRRSEYACPCTVKTAGKPSQPIEKSTASASVLAQVIVAKYADRLPLHRQAKPPVPPQMIRISQSWWGCASYC